MIPDRLSGSASSAVASAKADPRRRRGAAARLRLPFAVAAVALAVYAAHVVEQRLAVRAALAQGEDAFRRGDFVRAADWFRDALAIDPASTAVRLRLAAAYQKLYVPGGESLANDGVASRALAEIARVLERDPSNHAAILAAADISDSRSDYGQARDWYRRLAAIDSSSAAAFAGMSASSWIEVSGAVLDAEARAGLLLGSLGQRSAQREGGPIANDLGAEARGAKSADLRQSLAARWSATIAEGIDAASTAVTIDREHERAMLTLAAWHALAADLAPSPDEYRRHTIAADEWRHKALDARRLKAERSSQ
jgi:tetratricopeptide (TPR) repeat protein